jgi:hypothetical protein
MVVSSFHSWINENSVELTKDQVEFLDSFTSRPWEVNTETGLVDIYGNFDCSGQDIVDFKGVRFGDVKGDFMCNESQITSLEGSPRNVDGHFDCEFNQLTSLNGAPDRIGGHFWCSNNLLKDLKGSPKIVEGDFYCGSNKLTTLEGAPESIGKHFNCRNNLLTSLKGAPKIIGGDFFCEKNLLTSLEGAPKIIGTSIKIMGGVHCEKNPVSADTLKSIYSIMVNGDSYPDALAKYWNNMPESDKELMYKDNPELSDYEKRGYELANKTRKIII